MRGFRMIVFHRIHSDDVWWVFIVAFCLMRAFERMTGTKQFPWDFWIGWMTGLIKIHLIGTVDVIYVPAEPDCIMSINFRLGVHFNRWSDICPVLRPVLDSYQLFVFRIITSTTGIIFNWDICELQNICTKTSSFIEWVNLSLLKETCPLLLFKSKSVQGWGQSGRED